MPRARAPFAALVAAAVLGAGLSLAVAWAAGAFDHKTIETRIQPAAAGAPVHGAGTGWARSVYAKRIGGVVTVLVDTEDGVTTSGAGFVVNAAKGLVVTNSHVVTNSSVKGVTPATVRKYTVFIQREDKGRVPATIVGYDLFDDIAVLHFDPSLLPIASVPLGTTSSVRVGDPVAAIGAPFGHVDSLSVGVVSQIGTQIVAPAAGCFRTTDAIQTDAAVNPGNSGGPLFDTAGKVIGVTSQIDTPNPTVDSGSGVAFAVPVDAVKASFAQLTAPGSNGEVHYAFLGIAGVTLTPDVVGQFHLKTPYGVQVGFVEPGSDAARAGLSRGGRPTALDGRQVYYKGDVITALDGKVVRTIGDLQRDVAPLKVGAKVQVTWYHAGMTKRSETVTLGERVPLDAAVCRASAQP
jgi:S1-C subfamily serine protease